MAADWWNPNGKFKPLHLFNPARISFIKDKLISHFNLNPNSEKPLNKLKILDIGCGGGLLCEPLTRLGATMTGIDASSNNIKIAKLHSKEMNLSIRYICCSPENLNLENEFDVILNMEVVEHVSNVNLFIQNCSKVIKKNDGGLLLIDYGYTGKKMKNTLQGISNHKFANILDNIGKVDITHNISFDFFRKFTNQLDGLKNNLTTQRNFLIKMGINQRAEMMSKNTKIL